MNLGKHAIKDIPDANLLAIRESMNKQHDERVKLKNHKRFTKKEKDGKKVRKPPTFTEIAPTFLALKQEINEEINRRKL